MIRCLQRVCGSNAGTSLAVAPMSRATYRRHLARTIGLERDRDVAHIISARNGGADHPDNYDYVRGRGWNRMARHEYDHVNCFLAGREKCQKAVDASRAFGTYEGPGAEDMYAAGEKAFRRVLKLMLHDVR